MNIWDFDKLIIFILFVIPGFVMLKTYEVLNPSAYKSYPQQIIDVVAYSCINYGFLLIPIYYVEKSNIKNSSPICYYLFYLFILTIFPVILAFIWHKIRQSKHFQKIAPHPTLKPWDYVFSQRKPYWIKVKLKTGEIVAGKFAYKSFASSFPAREEIYLEEVWLLNEKKGFDRPKKRSEGVLILSDSIEYIEFFKYREN